MMCCLWTFNLCFSRSPLGLQWTPWTLTAVTTNSEIQENTWWLPLILAWLQSPAPGQTKDLCVSNNYCHSAVWVTSPFSPIEDNDMRSGFIQTVLKWFQSCSVKILLAIIHGSFFLIFQYERDVDDFLRRTTEGSRRRRHSSGDRDRSRERDRHRHRERR